MLHENLFPKKIDKEKNTNVKYFEKNRYWYIVQLKLVSSKNIKMFNWLTKSLFSFCF